MLHTRAREKLCMAALIAPALCAVLPAAIAGDCDEILVGGVRNQYALLRTGDFRTNFQYAFCGSHDASTSSGSGGSLGGMWDGIGIKVGGNQSNSSAVRNEVCGNTDSGMSDAKYVRALELVADPQIVDAWRECKNKTIGVIIEPDVHDENIVLKYVFKPSGPITEGRIVGDPVITGASCNRAVVDGTLINTGGLVQVCTREGNRPVNVAVNTDFAPATAYVPPVVSVPPPVKPPRENKPDLSIMGKYCVELRWKYAGASSLPPGVPLECFGRPGSGPLPVIKPDDQ